MTKNITLGLFTVIVCVSAGYSTTEASDPVIARVDAVYDDGTGLTPFVLHAANGDLIAHWATRGDGMPGQATRFARSSDLGKTWSKPYMTIGADKPLTGTATNLYNLPNGKILCYTLELLWPGEPEEPNAENMAAYLALAGGRKFDSYYSFTTDDGQTFSKKTLLSDPVKRNDFSQGNPVEVANGDLLWPWGCWTPKPFHGFKRSTDGGLTWGPTVRAWQDPPPGHDKPVGFNETAVAVCPDGTIVAVARVDTVLDKKFWQIKSSDNGKTWTTPRKIEIAGGAPAMYCTPQGQLWLAYRDGGVGPGLGLAVSDDNGDHWRFLYHLKHPLGAFEKRFGEGRYTDEDLKQQWRPNEGLVGYPCFAKISDSEVYIVFHAQMVHKPLPPGVGQQCIVGNLLRIPEPKKNRQ